MTRDQLAALGAKLGDLGTQTLAAVERERPQDKFVKAWNDALTGAKEGAADFGASFSRQMNEAMRELGETWNSMTRKDAPAPENSAVGSRRGGSWRCNSRRGLPEGAEAAHERFPPFQLRELFELLSVFRSVPQGGRRALRRQWI